jgi:hypothetical protein
MMVNHLPATHSASLGVFNPIIQIKNPVAAPAGDPLDDFVKPGLGFHGPVLKGQHVIVELGEEGKVPADVLTARSFVFEKMNVGSCAARRPACNRIMASIGEKMSAKNCANSSSEPSNPVVARTSSKNC